MKQDWHLLPCGTRCFQVSSFSEEQVSYRVQLYYTRTGKVTSVNFVHGQSYEYRKAFQRIQREFEPEKAHLRDRKMNAKRRGLELKFEEGHHFNRNQIIYIPSELHRSVVHSLASGKGMEEINKLAFEWLDQELVRKAFDALKDGRK